MPTEQPRLPPGQVETRKWPVLHYGRIPNVDVATWKLRIWGEVEQPWEIGWSELQQLPRPGVTCDLHCVTKWSRMDNVFEGVAVSELLSRARPKATAHYVLVHAAPDYTTNLPLPDLDRPENLIALSWNGEPLTAEHGG